MAAGSAFTQLRGQWAGQC